MAYFQEICHGICSLRYVGWVREFRKLDFRGLEGHFDVKKANFRGLITKIGYLRPILTSRTNQWPILREYVIEIVP